MCKLNFLNISNSQCTVRVLETEKSLYESRIIPGSLGTIDVLQHLSSDSEQPLAIHLVLGSDTFSDLCKRKWKESDTYVLKLLTLNNSLFFRILNNYSIEVIQRRNPTTLSSSSASSADPSDTNEVMNDQVKVSSVRFHTVSFLGNVSSTSIREALQNTEVRRILFNEGFDPPAAVDQMQVVQSETKETQHSTAVAELADMTRKSLDPAVLKYILLNNLYI
jgi:hypothetical protein